MEVSLADETAFTHKGTLDFVDNALDRSSGTIHARATILNSDLLQTPGGFARVRLAVAPPAPALLVPDASVLPDQSEHVVLDGRAGQRCDAEAGPGRGFPRRSGVLDNAALLAGEDADSARRRAATLFALLVTAGALAKEFGVLPAESDIVGAEKWGWARFCKSIEAESLDPSTQVLDNIRLWIAERWDSTCRHIGSTFHYLHKADAWYDTTTIYIPRATIGAAGGHVLSTEALVKLLNDGGQLEKRDSSRRATVRYIPGVGRITAYALKRTRFGPTSVRMMRRHHERCARCA